MQGSEDTDGWRPIAGAEPPAERLELDDLALLNEVSHPIRSQIIRRLRNPRTVADIARDLDVPVTRLYHHMNHLVERGLIRVVATRKVAAVTERRYQVVAIEFGVAEHLLESEDRAAVSAALGSLFDAAKLGMQRDIESGTFSLTETNGVLSMGEVVLSPDRRRQLLDRLTELISEFSSDANDDDPDGTRMTLFISAIPHSLPGHEA